MAYCKWFKQISKKDIPIAGGKGANLGEMFNAGFPVPPGYIILASTYNQFLKEKKIDKKIQEKLQDINIEDSEQLQKIAKEIQTLFLQYQMSSDMKEEIQEFYQYIETDEELKNVKLAEGLLTNGRDLPFVAGFMENITPDFSELICFCITTAMAIFMCEKLFFSL